MFKTSYNDFFDSGKNTSHSKAKTAVKEFRHLLELLNGNDLFKKFFLFKGTLDPDQRKSLSIEDNEFSSLMNYGVLSCNDELWSSNVMCNKNLLDVGRDWFIITDWPDISPSGDKYPAKEMVFPIHFESIFLCKTLSVSELHNKKALDIFCGSGILGVYAALCGVREIHFIDLNQRCLVFTQFNMLLNFPELLEKDCQPTIAYNLFASDVFSDLDPSHKYNVILANPPFEPVPESLEKFYFTHSYGGPTGQLFLERFLDAYEGHLEDDGVVIGVDFSPGADEVEKTEISGIFGSRANCYLPKPIQSCNLREFASRYIALGMTIADYKTWMDHLQALSFNKLYLFWFACAKNAKVLEEVKVCYESRKLEVMENWVNPLHWNYPCGITAENMLQWTYLDDSFYMREMLSHMQLSNEKLFSEGGVPEYLDFNGLRREKGFQNAIETCNKYLKEFQYGVLGKPSLIEWMTFPEIKDGDVVGNGFSISQASLSRPLTRDELLLVIEENLSDTDRPKIVMYYEIYDVETKHCTSYFGELANFTISMILTDGVKRVYDNGTGEITEIQVENFLDTIRGGDGVGFASPFGPANRPKQTYCFIFTWDKNACEAFTDIINYKDKVFFDGMYKRLSFIISQGLNLVAMVGLAQKVSLGDRLSRLQKAEKNIRALLSQLNDITQLALQIESHIGNKNIVEEFNGLSTAISDLHIDKEILFDKLHDFEDFLRLSQSAKDETLAKVVTLVKGHNTTFASDVVDYIKQNLCSSCSSDESMSSNAFNIMKVFFDKGSIFYPARCSAGVAAYHILKLKKPDFAIEFYYNDTLLPILTTHQLFNYENLFLTKDSADTRMRINPWSSGHEFAYQLGELVSYLSSNRGRVKVNSVHLNIDSSTSRIILYCDNIFEKNDLEKMRTYVLNNEIHHGLSGRIIRLTNCIINGSFECADSTCFTESPGIIIVSDTPAAKTKFIVKVQ